MTHTRNKQKSMKKHMRMLAILLIPVIALILGAASPELWAGNHDDDYEGNGGEQPFKDAEFFIEYNSTAGDTGVQVFLDDDNWRRITISDPRDRKIFTVKGSATLGRQGLTELFFESVEPELDQLPIVKFLKRFPEGAYEFEGIRNDGIDLESEVEFTHIIPCAPAARPENGTVIGSTSEAVIRWDKVTDVVDPVETDKAGETVCTDPGNLDQVLEIASYQVIVENSDIHLIVDLTSEDRAMTIPPELLRRNTLYIFEVLAKEESGNQTISEGFFCTGPRLTEGDCEDLFEAF